MSDVELDANSDVATRRPKIQAAPALNREIVYVADAAVIEPDSEFSVRKHEIVGIRAHAHTAHQRHDRTAVEMVEADLADRSDEWHITPPRAGDVEMGACIAGRASLVVDDVVIRAERREVRIAG